MQSEYPADEKADYRSRCRRFRAAMDLKEYERLSSSIVDRALAGDIFDSAGVIHVYWPIIDRREIDTRPLIAALHQLGKQLVIPAVVSGLESSAGRMAYRLFAGAGNMQKNAWGTYEPIAEGAVPERVDLVVAPALGADRNGFRLGYGGGFYDRFLKEADCPALSLVYSGCLFDSVPHDPHDVKVDLIVTEDELVRPGNLQPGSTRDRN